MSPALVAHVVDHLRKILRKKVAPLNLAIEDPKHVPLESPPAVIAMLRKLRPDGFPQNVPVGRPALRASDGVEHRAKTGEPENPHDFVENQDRLHIHPRVRRSDRLDAELVELPVAPLLRTLMPEDRPEIRELPEAALLVEVVLQKRTHNRRRQFRAQGEGFLLRAKRIHLLFDDVGRLARRLVEELGLLEDGRADFFVAEPTADFADGRLHLSPEGHAIRKHVLGTVRGPVGSW